MILVTGGTGLVGAHLLLELIRKGEKVRATHRKPSNFDAINTLFKRNKLDNEFQRIEWIETDILDVLSLDKAFINIKHVFHCAAIVSFNPKDIDSLYKINIEGTANIVNLSLYHKIEKLCYISSTAAIGKTKDGELSTEDTPWIKDNASHYSISKYRAEQEVWRGHEEGLDVVMINPSIIIGENEWGKSSTNIITSVWKGLSFYTKGSNAFVDVKDVVKTIILLKESNIINERFLVTAENWSFEKLFSTIAKYLQKKPPSIVAGNLLLNIAWREEKLRSKLSKSTPIITKETALTAQTIQRFSNQKIKDALQYNFIPLDKTIKDTCITFLNDQNKV